VSDRSGSTTAASAPSRRTSPTGPYYPDAERSVLSTFVPPQGYRQRNDATYFPIPWVLSSEGYGVLVENEETAYHDFRGDRQWSVEVTTAPDDFGADQRAPASLRLRVFGGGTPARTLRRFTKYTGRQPAPACAVGLGLLVQPGGSLDEQLGSWRRCAGPTRRYRSCRRTSTTSRVATKSARKTPSASGSTRSMRAARR
jgi:hypothetical protein